MPEQKLKDIFPLYPKEMHNILVQVATGHTSYLRFRDEHNENLFVPMSEGQRPMGPALMGCSDSRMGKWIVGRKGETAQVLEYRCVGAILTEPVDINASRLPVLKEDALETVELAAHYGNDVIQSGHDGCGANAVFFTYHMRSGGKQEIWDKFGPAFVQKAERHFYLVDIVNQRLNVEGLRHYRDLGFNLGNDPENFVRDNYKFTLAMSIEQTEFNRLALEAVKKQYDNDALIKNKLGIIGSVVVVLANPGNEIYMFSPKEGKYLSIPALDHSFLRRHEAKRPVCLSRDHGKNCGCGLGGVE